MENEGSLCNDKRYSETRWRRRYKHYWLWSSEWYHQVKMVTKQERWFSVQNIQDSWPISFSSTEQNNRNIFNKRTSFFYEEWMEKGIWAIIHLLELFLNTWCFHWETQFVVYQQTVWVPLTKDLLVCSYSTRAVVSHRGNTFSKNLPTTL